MLCGQAGGGDVGDLSGGLWPVKANVKSVVTGFVTFLPQFSSA